MVQKNIKDLKYYIYLNIKHEKNIKSEEQWYKQYGIFFILLKNYKSPSLFYNFSLHLISINFLMQQIYS